MHKFSHPCRAMIAVSVLSLVIAGCASTGQQAGDGSTVAGGGDGGSRGCNAGVAAVLGGVAGALLGGKEHAARGAAIGAGVAALACVAYNYNVEQVKTREQVQQEYKSANKGKLPATTVVDRYETRFAPAVIKPGEKAVLTSYVQIVQGGDNAAPKVEEEATLYGPDGKELKKARKPVNQDVASGAFQTTFALPMPSGVPQGVYRMDTRLFLDGKENAKRSAKLQIAATDTGMPVLVALHADGAR
jgi:hypothetical protein